jgi:hypothetical protein
MGVFIGFRINILILRNLAYILYYFIGFIINRLILKNISILRNLAYILCYFIDFIINLLIIGSILIIRNLTYILYYFIKMLLFSIPGKPHNFVKVCLHSGVHNKDRSASILDTEGNFVLTELEKNSIRRDKADGTYDCKRVET